MMAQVSKNISRVSQKKMESSKISAIHEGSVSFTFQHEETNQFDSLLSLHKLQESVAGITSDEVDFENSRYVNLQRTTSSLNKNDLNLSMNVLEFESFQKMVNDTLGVCSLPDIRKSKSGSSESEVSSFQNCAEQVRTLHAIFQVIDDDVRPWESRKRQKTVLAILSGGSDEKSTESQDFSEPSKYCHCSSSYFDSKCPRWILLNFLLRMGESEIIELILYLHSLPQEIHDISELCVLTFRFCATICSASTKEIIDTHRNRHRRWPSCSLSQYYTHLLDKSVVLALDRHEEMLREHAFLMKKGYFGFYIGVLKRIPGGIQKEMVIEGMVKCLFEKDFSKVFNQDITRWWVVSAIFEILPYCNKSCVKKICTDMYALFSLNPRNIGHFVELENWDFMVLNNIEYLTNNPSDGICNLDNSTSVIASEELPSSSLSTPGYEVKPVDVLMSLLAEGMIQEMKTTKKASTMKERIIELLEYCGSIAHRDMQKKLMKFMLHRINGKKEFPKYHQDAFGKSKAWENVISFLEIVAGFTLFGNFNFQVAPTEIKLSLERDEHSKFVDGDLAEQVFKMLMVNFGRAFRGSTEDIDSQNPAMTQKSRTSLKRFKKFANFFSELESCISKSNSSGLITESSNLFQSFEIFYGEMIQEIARKLTLDGQTRQILGGTISSAQGLSGFLSSETSRSFRSAKRSISAKDLRLSFASTIPDEPSVSK